MEVLFYKFIYRINMKGNERGDLQELFTGQKYMQNGWAPEQERNFDAGYLPEKDRMVMKGYEMIDGKRYKVWQA